MTTNEVKHQASVVPEPAFVELRAQPTCEIQAVAAVATPNAPHLAATVRIGNAAVDFYSGADPVVIAALCQAMK